MWVGLRCGLQHTYIEGPTRWPHVYLTSHHTMPLCDFTLFTCKALLVLPASFFGWLPSGLSVCLSVCLVSLCVLPWRGPLEGAAPHCQTAIGKKMPQKFPGVFCSALVRCLRLCVFVVSLCAWSLLSLWLCAAGPRLSAKFRKNCEKSPRLCVLVVSPFVCGRHQWAGSRWYMYPRSLALWLVIFAFVSWLFPFASSCGLSLFDFASVSWWCPFALGPSFPCGSVRLAPCLLGQPSHHDALRLHAFYI